MRYRSFIILVNFFRFSIVLSFFTLLSRSLSLSLSLAGRFVVSKEPEHRDSTPPFIPLRSTSPPPRGCLLLCVYFAVLFIYLFIFSSVNLSLLVPPHAPRGRFQFSRVYEKPSDGFSIINQQNNNSPRVRPAAVTHVHAAAAADRFVTVRAVKTVRYVWYGNACSVVTFRVLRFRAT